MSSEEKTNDSQTNSFKSFVAFIEEHSPKHYGFLLAIPVTLLVTGFIIWNVYLYTFGFLEDELLKAKFILAGFFFYLISSIVLGAVIWIFELVTLLIKILRFIYLKLTSFRYLNFFRLIENNLRKFNLYLKSFKPFKETQKILKISLASTVFIFWFLFYVIYIFPGLPGIFGGGQPRSLSLIAPKTAIPILTTFGIKIPEGATNQTQNLCIVHENSQGIYVLLPDRILMMDKSFYQGFGSLGGVRAEGEQSCIRLAKQWSLSGFSISLLLFETQVVNFYRTLIGLPQEFFILEAQKPENIKPTKLQ